MPYKNKEKEKEYQKKWREKNKEKVCAYIDKWNSQNPFKRKLIRKKWQVKNPEKYAFYRIKSNAKRRKIEFNLKLEEFLTFWQKSCYYCGKKIKTYGLDRIDNFQGYKLENLTPCCLECNMFKARLSKDKFINQCRKIAKHLNEG